MALAGTFATAHAQAGSRSGMSVPTLRVAVAEWSVVPSVGVVRAGPVRIEVSNLGDEAHQLEVARTTRFADELPLRGSRAFVRPVARSLVIAPGTTRSFVVSLKTGSYVLLDNLPWHYWKGTSVAIAVR